MAPSEWQDREKLWNTVEEAEKAKDSRLAREFVVAPPVELNRKDRIALLEEFIQTSFVADGMCADAAIHDTDGHNPHAHILLTVRGLSTKTVHGNIRRRRNICAFETARNVDSAARGLSEQPTIHEGVVARALEQIGVTSDRCELNRQIKADKKLLRELKAQMERLLKAVKNTIPAIAEAMETVRQNMLIIRYQILHTRASKRKISDTLNAVLPDFRKYTEIVKQLRDKTKERRDLLVEKKATPIFI